MKKRSKDSLSPIGNRLDLGPLEAQIMEIIWKRGEVNVRDVYDILRQERDLAYTTVMTVVHNLRRKGLLIQRVEGNKHFFKASQSRDQFIHSKIAKLLDNVLEDFTEPVIAHLAERLSKGDEKQLAEFERLIANYRTQGKRNDRV